MSYAPAPPLGFWNYIIEGVASTTTASVKTGAGAYKKQERAAKSDLQAARYELEAARSGAAATEQSAQITAEGAVDAAAIRIAAAKKAREKQTKMLIIAAAVAVLGVGAVVLLSGGKAGS